MGAITKPTTYPKLRNYNPFRFLFFYFLTSKYFGIDPLPLKILFPNLEPTFFISEKREKKFENEKKNSINFKVELPTKIRFLVKNS